MVAETYWARRRNNHADLLSLLVANAVTGAASLFPRDCSTTRCRSRRPSSRTSTTTGSRCCALATGEIALRRPAALRLRPARRARRSATRRPTGCRRCATALGALRRDPRERDPAVADALLRRRLPAAAVRDGPAACAAATGWRRRSARALERFLARRPLAAAARPARGRAARASCCAGGRRRSAPSGCSLHAFAWRRLRRRRRARRARGGRCGSTRCRRRAWTRGRARARPASPRCGRSPRRSRRCGCASRDDAPAARQPAHPDDRPAALLRRLHRQAQPRPAAGRARAARADRHRRPGAAAAARLARAASSPTAGWRAASTASRSRSAASRPGLEVSRARPLRRHHLVDRPHRRTRRARLGGERFLYLIQEYEPFTFPMGTYAALADESYRLPAHRAVLDRAAARLLPPPRASASTRRATQAGDARVGGVRERDHRRSSRPTAAELAGARDAPAAVLRAPRAARGAQHVRARRARARPRARAAARSRRLGAARDRHRRRSRGGSTSAAARRWSCCRAPPRATTRSVLREHDVGLALMYTPHPSLVPIEMASAGMLTVTNSFENKTAEALAAISPNLIAAEPERRGDRRRRWADGRRGRGRLRAPGRAAARVRLEPRLGRLLRRRAAGARRGPARPALTCRTTKARAGPGPSFHIWCPVRATRPRAAPSARGAG